MFPMWTSITMCSSNQDPRSLAFLTGSMIESPTVIELMCIFDGWPRQPIINNSVIYDKTVREHPSTNISNTLFNCINYIILSQLWFRFEGKVDMGIICKGMCRWRVLSYNFKQFRPIRINVITEYFFIMIKIGYNVQSGEKSHHALRAKLRCRKVFWYGFETKASSSRQKKKWKYRSNWKKISVKANCPTVDTFQKRMNLADVAIKQQPSKFINSKRW